MLRRESVVVVADNTGALTAKIFGLPGASNKKIARIGDFVTVSIQQVNSGGILKKGQVVRAMIVRTRKEIRRNDGTYIRFGDNAVVVVEVTDKGEVKPRGKRIFGPIAREIRDLGYKNISNIAEEVI